MHTLVLYFSTSLSLFLLREGKNDLSERRPQSGGGEPECSPGRECSRCGTGRQVPGNFEEVSRDGSRAQVVGSVLDQQFWMNCPICIPKPYLPRRQESGILCHSALSMCLPLGRIHVCWLDAWLNSLSANEAWDEVRSLMAIVFIVISYCPCTDWPHSHFLSKIPFPSSQAK